MRKFFLAALCMLLTVSSFAAYNAKQLYDKYSGKSGVSSVMISPTILKMMSKLPSVKGVNLDAAIHSLTEMYVIETESIFVASDLKKDVQALVNSGQYELLLKAKDEDEDTFVYVAMDDKYITEFIVLDTERNECSFISITGKFSMDDIGRMMKDLDD